MLISLAVVQTQPSLTKTLNHAGDGGQLQSFPTPRLEHIHFGRKELLIESESPGEVTLKNRKT